MYDIKFVHLFTESLWCKAKTSFDWLLCFYFTSLRRTDDIGGINYTIQQWQTMGKIPAGGFITKLYSATVPTVSKYGKIC